MPDDLPDDDEGRESLVEIDEFALDREWLRQPQLFMRYAMKLADARKEFSIRKAKLDVVKAELSSAIRNDPTAYGMKKATERGIDDAVLLQPEYKKALRLLNEAKHNVDLLTAVVEALEHRKKALESLVYLHGANYFSQPRERKGSGESVEDRVKREARRATKLKRKE